MSIPPTTISLNCHPSKRLHHYFAMHASTFASSTSKITPYRRVHMMMYLLNPKNYLHANGTKIELSEFVVTHNTWYYSVRGRDIRSNQSETGRYQIPRKDFTSVMKWMCNTWMQRSWRDRMYGHSMMWHCMMDEECRLFRETIDIYRRKAVRVCMELVRYVAMSLTLAADGGDAHLFDEYFT